MHGSWQYLWLGLWIAIGYPFLGWYALFGAVLIAIIYTLESEKDGLQRFMPLFLTII